MVDIDNDLALLMPATPINNSSGLRINKGYKALIHELLTAIGHPQGMDINRKTVYAGNPITEQLTHLIPTAASSSFEQRGSPAVQIEILYLEGNLVPGQSGGPILNSKNEVIGVVDGGILGGSAGISWAIPFNHLKFTNAKSVDNSGRLGLLAKLKSEDLFAYEGQALSETHLNKHPIIGVIIVPNIAILPAKGIVNNMSLSADIGFIHYFNIKNKLFSFELDASVLPVNIVSANQYITLPGEKGTVNSKFSIQKLPGAELCYYIKPFNYDVNYFFGLEISNNKQSLIEENSKAANLNESYSPYHSFDFGIRAGVCYKIYKRISFQLGIDCTEFTLQNVTYQFNYFGRANQILFLKKYLLLNIIANVAYNF